jgi:hypothetical protein
MTASEASWRARDLWARLPTQRIGPAIEPLVLRHIDLVKATVDAVPPPPGAWCLALNPVTTRGEEGDECLFAYGLREDRERLIADGDAISAWNATLLDFYVDAVAPIRAVEQPVRERLADEGVVMFDYWVLCEVARRLNDLRVAPAGASDDFISYCFDEGMSEDFELGLAYSTPPAIYRQFADRGLVKPNEAVPASHWLDFNIELE